MKLLHGDCLEVMKDIPNDSIDMILCDLPYGTTSNKWDSIIPFKPLWEQYWRILKSNGVIILTAQCPFDKVLGMSQIQYLKYEWIWKKESGTGFLNAKKMPLKDCENILVFYKKLPIYNPQMRKGFKAYECKKGGESSNYRPDISKNVITKSNDERYPLQILEFSRDKDKIHPTQKPVALMEYLIKTYTNECDIILDNCMGSGTTGVACKNLNRKFIGIEKDPQYYYGAVARLAQ